MGAGWSALDRAIPYSVKRIQAGAPLSEKQGYTHKLIVPNVARLEAARAVIEETAERIDAGKEGSLNTEGAIAKYMSTEAGNAAADASIQALGGYGYTHEYMVEKMSRDVRITRIYEGTSEIMEMTISPRPLAASPENAWPALSRSQAKAFEKLHCGNPTWARILLPWRCMPLPRSWRRPVSLGLPVSSMFCYVSANGSPIPSVRHLRSSRSTSGRRQFATKRPTGASMQGPWLLSAGSSLAKPL